MKKTKTIIALFVCVCCLLLLVACTSSPNPETVAKNLTDDGYIVNSIPASDTGLGLSLKINHIKHRITGGKFGTGDDFYSITINWYTSESKAQSAYEELLEEMPSSNVYKKGNMVAYGDDEAIEFVKTM